MSSKKENIAKVREEFQKKRFAAEEAADMRKAEINARIPETVMIDLELRSTAPKIMAAAAKSGNTEAALAKIREENERLRAKKSALLIKHGYPKDYTEIKYECDKCGDTGFVGIDMCQCMRRALTDAYLASSGIGKRCREQGFDNFSLDYYDAQSRPIMEHAFNTLESFAKDFRTRRGENYLLIGGTGLGKTHLSSALARSVIENGFDVTYSTIQDIMLIFERQRFGDGNVGDGSCDDIFSCDLLIIDDLGVELVNQFTVSTLYSIINSRINRELSTVISTNLTASELRAKYADRITSRIFGEFTTLVFRGTDIRAKKLL